MAHPRSGPSHAPTQRLVGPALAVLAAVGLVLGFGDDQLVAGYSSRMSTAAIAVPVVLGGGVVLLLLNRFLSRLARNGGRLGAKGWDWGGKVGVGEGAEVVVVTGGSLGIGAAVVQQLSERVGRGVKLVVLDLAPPPEPLGPNVTFHACDVTDRAAVFAAAKQIEAEVGKPTVLINNAGVVRPRAVLGSTQRDVDLTFGVNCKAHYWTTQAFLPAMVESNHGHVVTMASSTAYVQSPFGVAYAASKAGALAFHEGLGLELRYVHGATRVRTSVVCPGHVKTRMFEGFTPGLLPGWVAPSLEVGEVAGQVVRAVLSGESQHVISPAYSELLPMLRAMPTWVYHLALYLAKDSLREVRAPEDGPARGTAMADKAD